MRKKISWETLLLIANAICEIEKPQDNLLYMQKGFQTGVEYRFVSGRNLQPTDTRGNVEGFVEGDIEWVSWQCPQTFEAMTATCKPGEGWILEHPPEVETSFTQLFDDAPAP